MDPRLPSPEPRPGTAQGLARRLISLKEAAAVLGVSPASIRRLIWAGTIPTVRLTRRIQVDTRDLDQLIERRKERSPR